MLHVWEGSAGKTIRNLTHLCSERQVSREKAHHRVEKRKKGPRERSLKGLKGRICSDSYTWMRAVEKNVVQKEGDIGGRGNVKVVVRGRDGGEVRKVGRGGREVVKESRVKGVGWEGSGRRSGGGRVDR